MAYAGMAASRTPSGSFPRCSTTSVRGESFPSSVKRRLRALAPLASSPPVLASGSSTCWYVHSHRTLLRWSRSVTGAGELIRLMGRTAPTPLLRGQADSAVMPLLSSLRLGVIPSVVRYSPRGGSCQPSSTTGWRREACSHVTSTDPSPATAT